MVQEDRQLQEAKSYAVKLLAQYPRTISEIKDKLKRKKYSDRVAEITIRYFIENEILSDEKYAKEWIESQLRNRPTSRAICRKKLFQRGLPNDLINQALDDYYDSEKEEEIAYDLAVIKLERIREKFSNKKKIKIGQYLNSKGFSEPVIWSVLEKMNLE